ncbi:MAG: Na+/H+ antiporter [Candidatus Saccharibacteria bacterium]
MQNYLIEYIYLILIILALVMISNKLKLAYPLILVLGGLVLGFTTSFSKITIDPEMIFFLFLPPLLYEAAWQISWKEFVRWKRVIISFAFPIVILTSCVVALVSNTIIPGFTLALGFLLGGIVSPPDAVSATTIMRQVNVPKTLVSITEGESLLNDASSLIVFRFALAAIITGQFNFQQAATSFVLVIVMGALIGLAMGLMFYSIHRWLPTTPSIDIILTLVTPYCMYFPAEHFHFSGVLAVVCGGLFLSNRRHRILTYESRMRGVNVWINMIFIFNGLIFMLIGLQLPSIISQLGEISLIRAIGYGLAISLTLVVTRLICTLGASLFTHVMSNFIKVADPNPGWRSPIVLGWAGMRGVVSLAAALSLPMVVNGEAFPYRSLILFITFIVIMVTLVFQGLTLPWVIRKVKPEDKFSSLSVKQQDINIQKAIAQASIHFLEDKHMDAKQSNDHVKVLYKKLNADLNFFDQEFDESEIKEDQPFSAYQQIYLDLLQNQRKVLNQLNQNEDYDEELIRKYHALIDLEEFKIKETLIHHLMPDDSDQTDPLAPERRIGF